MHQVLWTVVDSVLQPEIVGVAKRFCELEVIGGLWGAGYVCECGRKHRVAKHTRRLLSEVLTEMGENIGKEILEKEHWKKNSGQISMDKG